MLRRSLHLLRGQSCLLMRSYSTALHPDDSNHLPSEHAGTEYVNTIEVSHNSCAIPAYRLLEPKGQLTNASALSVDKDLCVRIYKHMTSLHEMDKILFECQRQGRISFYMTHFGEEAAVIGSAAGLKDDDLVFPQYREAGILLWRGFRIDQCVNQCFGNKLDMQKSKQMPVHYGSKEHHFVTISSPIATQLPQAAGAAYAYKLTKNGRCVITFFGDGASSEGDAHAALNFASTLECPVIFFCRNNKYAISTPIEEQCRNGIASRAVGYGMPAIKVDGNDVFAVLHTVQTAREYVMTHNKPILIEALTYRKGHHSTSDDSSAYRSKSDISKWDTLDPIHRLRLFLQDAGWWSDQQETSWTIDLKQQILSTINDAEKIKKPKWETMFDDVYDELPHHLKEQKDYVRNHLRKFPNEYPVEEFEKA